MVIRLGIIGLSTDPQAWATMAHLAPITGRLSSQYKLTAIATSSPETAKASAKAYGLPEEKGHSDPNDIANDPDVDMVVVSVKVPLHKQMTLPALKAKKDVFVEWPLGNGVREAQEMVDMVKRMGVRNFVGLQLRMQPAYVKAREIVQSGILGRTISTTVLKIDNKLLDLPEKARYVNDPTSGTFQLLSFVNSGSPRPIQSRYFPVVESAQCVPHALSPGASVISVAIGHALDVTLHVLSSELSSLTAQTATTHPTLRYRSLSGSLSHPEPKHFADNFTISGLLTPGNAVLNFQYFITAPPTPSIFQWIICGEKGAFKMEWQSFAMQLVPPIKMYVTVTPEVDDGLQGMYESREGGAGWKELELPESKVGCFGGVGEIYEGIAKGMGPQSGMVDFEEAVKRHKMIEAIIKSAKDGTRERYL
ncbi:MAG: hypothetical protein Q9226_000915 [Calogaya cf. arnoldii]